MCVRLLLVAAPLLAGCQVSPVAVATGTPTATDLPFAHPTRAEASPMTITIVYDNYGHGPSLATSWGFSCLVNYGGSLILFDAGGDAATLLANMELQDIDPQEIELVLLSHDHGDLTGGLGGSSLAPALTSAAVAATYRMGDE